MIFLELSIKRWFMIQTWNNRLSHNCYCFDWAVQAPPLILKQTVPSIANSHMDIQLQDLAGKKVHNHKIKLISAENNEYLTRRPACASAVVMGRFHALRISHRIMFWFGVSRTLKSCFSIISRNVFFIFPPIRPLSTWSPQNKLPSPC